MAEQDVKLQNLRAGTVAILDYRRNVVGSGFIAAPNNYICTCAHVLDSTGKSDSIDIIFLNGEKGTARVEIKDKNADVAVLIPNNIPSDVVPLILGESRSSDGHTFSAYGFPNRLGKLSGGYAQGNIMGSIANG